MAAVTPRPEIEAVRARIEARSADLRRGYLEGLARMRREMPQRRSLSCSNMAHVVAACGSAEKGRIAGGATPNLGIVTAYNDMLSAHQPLESFPRLIKEEAAAQGATAQVAGGVPAMCDGVTQGQPGMELSLFSATSSRWRRRSRSATTSSTPRCIWASATRSFPAS